MRLLAKLEKQKKTWFLLVVLFFFFLLRLPSLFEPNWYGDEGIYQVIGTALHKGRHLYTGIWDNKPPLLYYIYALWNGDQFSVRLFSILFGIGAIIVFFFIAKKLFIREKVIFISTGIFALLFATPFLEGNIANAENFMLFPIALAGLLVLRATIHPSKKRHQIIINLFWSGILLGIAFLIKIVAIFDFGAFFIFYFISMYKGKDHILSQIKSLLLFGIGFLIPFLVTCIFFFIQGNFRDFLLSAFFSNVGYVEYGNSFFIPHGLLVIKLIGLLFFVAILFHKRMHISVTHLFVLIWVVFALFDMFFSQRPYTHYVLTGIISFSLFIGLVIAEKKEKKLLLLLGICCLILIEREFTLRARIPKFLFGYYRNFIAFTLQQQKTSDYLTFFDKITPRDYTIADFINTNKKTTDRIFLWGDDAQVYKLTNLLPPGRFIVAYHIVSSASNMRETASALAQNPPRYIIVFPKQSIIPYSMMYYQPKIQINDTTIYEKIF